LHHGLLRVVRVRFPPPAAIRWTMGRCQRPRDVAALVRLCAPDQPVVVAVGDSSKTTLVEGPAEGTMVFSFES
jgi:hypothetical protein